MFDYEFIRKNNLENDLKSANDRYAERGKELTENDVDFKQNPG